MPRLHLIRHGKAAAAWSEDADPDLDEEGRAQAAGLAEALAPSGPLPVVCSPLLRTRSTAGALLSVFGGTARIDPRVGEIPSPAGPEGELENRGRWLAQIMSRTWDDAEMTAALQAWRAGVIESLLELEDETAVVTHFVAINAAVGQAVGDRRVVVFSPGYCSRTVLDTEGGRLRLVERGAESPTVVG